MTSPNRENTIHFIMPMDPRGMISDGALGRPETIPIVNQAKHTLPVLQSVMSTSEDTEDIDGIDTESSDWQFSNS